MPPPSSLPQHSPEGGVDLQGFAEHLGSDVLHVVAAQVHLPQAGVAAQGVDQHGAAGAQPRLGEGQSLQRLQRPRGQPSEGFFGLYDASALKQTGDLRIVSGRAGLSVTARTRCSPDRLR